MTDYNYELSFDWNAAHNSEANLPLDFGRMKAGQVDDLNSHLTQWQDAVCFDLCNRTSGATVNDDYSIVSGKITLAAHDSTQSAASPFNITEMQIGPVPPGPTLIHNLIFDGDFQSWTPVVPLMQVVTPGDFQFTVVLTIKGPDGTQKTFVADPEMIIDSAG